MKSYFVSTVTTVVTLLVISWTTSHATTLASYRFDGDTVGSLPAGWTGATAANAYVTNNVSQTAPNSFAHQINLDNNNYTAAISFPGYSLTAGARQLSYKFDVNVDFIDTNDSEGYVPRIWTGFSQIDAGTPRILRNGANWRFYNGLAGANGGPFYIGNFNFDQWYNFRVVFTPFSTSAGRAEWYMDGVLINTENYSGKGLNQTANIDVFDIRNLSDGNTATGARVYFDNVVVEIIPEPSTVLLLLVGGGIAWKARRRREESNQ